MENVNFQKIIYVQGSSGTGDKVKEMPYDFKNRIIEYKID